MVVIFLDVNTMIEISSSYNQWNLWCVKKVGGVPSKRMSDLPLSWIGKAFSQRVH